MPSLSRRVFAEWLGTAFLLAAVVGSGIMAQRLTGGNVALALLCNTIPTGAILVVLILVFAPLSGAHFNPAVTLAFALRRELPWHTAGLYIAAQLIGAIAGVWIAHLMFELPVWQFSLTTRTGIGQWVAETVATFGLLLTIFGCTARSCLASCLPSSCRAGSGVSRTRQKCICRKRDFGPSLRGVRNDEHAACFQASS
jgi:glycerol uptake facilitator-like aquaporin